MLPKVILWLEDRSETVLQQIRICKDNGIEVELVSTAYDFYEFLEKRADEVCLIIIDIMLYSVRNLDTIGIPNSDTGGGYKAGWVLIEQVLRPEEKGSKYLHIPVLIVSSRPFSDYDKDILRVLNSPKRARGAPKIEYLEKGGFGRDGRKGWSQDFELIIQKWCF